MSASVIAREFDRLATRNAELLNTPAKENEPLEETKARSDEFEANLDRLNELKRLLGGAGQLDELQKWASTPERRAAVFSPDEQEPPAADGRKARETKTPGQQFVENEQFKAFLQRVAPNGQISGDGIVDSGKIPVKAVVTGASATGGGAFFERDYTGIYVPYIQPALTVRDLVINATTDADLVEFVRAVTHANAAAPVAEATTAADPATYGDPASGIKPEGSFTWEKVTAQVEPIAESVPITRRALMNSGQMRSIVDDQLRYDLRRTINTQMLEGSGTSPNLRGIRNTTGILTQAFSNNIIETLRKAKTKISSPSTGSGKVPDGVAITPENLETLDLFRVGGSTTTDGPFLVNPYGDAPRRLWGMNLVEESGLTANKAVVGFFRDAVLWDREIETIQAFNQHKDYAARNLIFLLAEWWGTFGVLQPKSFCDATLA